jgi:hypothetical protein
MQYKAKTAVCSDIHTKHSKQSGHHVDFFNIQRGGTYKNR